MRFFLAGLLLISPLAAQGVNEYECVEGEESCEERDLEMEDQYMEYYRRGYAGYRWKRPKEYTPPPEEVGNDWPGKMHDPLFDALTR